MVVVPVLGPPRGLHKCEYKYPSESLNQMLQENWAVKYIENTSMVDGSNVAVAREMEYFECTEDS